MLRSRANMGTCGLLKQTGLNAISAGCHQGVLQRRVMRRLDLQPALVHAPRTAEQSAGRWARGALAIRVVNAAMAGAHEQSRLREPGNRTTQMGAIDGEDQELKIAT